jgi:hypothetical protein
MNNWQSSTIEVNGFELRVDASANGVDLGKVSGGIYASDLLLTPEQAMELADALTQGAAQCLAAREG